MHLTVEKVSIRSKLYKLDREEALKLEIDAFDVNNLRITEERISFEDRSGTTKYMFYNTPNNQPAIQQLRAVSLT